MSNPCGITLKMSIPAKPQLNQNLSADAIPTVGFSCPKHSILSWSNLPLSKRFYRLYPICQQELLSFFQSQYILFCRVRKGIANQHQSVSNPTVSKIANFLSMSNSPQPTTSNDVSQSRWPIRMF
jgi:hypothetical protein